MRRHDLPATVSFDIGVGIALAALGYCLAFALIFRHDDPDKDYDVAIRTRLNSLSVELHRRPTLWPRGLERREDLRLRLHPAVRERDGEVVGHDRIHCLGVMLFVS